MKRKYLENIKIENYSCKNIHYPKIEVLKRHQYFIVTGYSITGDAPKAFIRAYEYGLVRKKDSKK